MRRNVIGRFLTFILLGSLSTSVLAGCGEANSGGGGFFTYRSGQANVTEEQDSVKPDDSNEVVDEPNLYIVRSFDMAGESIAFYSTEVDRDIRYSYNLTTKFLDKYGQSTSSTNFTPGTVVVLGDVMTSSGALSTVQMAPGVDKQTDVTRFTIDEAKKLFYVADSKYKITADSLVFSDSDEIGFESITDQDVLTVTTKNGELLSVAVTTGHGYIELQNTELFVDSLIFVGNKIVTMIHGDDMIEVPEGTYEITVANEGWGGSGEFTVTRNEITTVDLDSIKGQGPSYCELIFEVAVDSCQIYLDGNLVENNESTSVRYGNHKLQVIADGYKTWSKTLVVNSSSAIISIDLATEDKTNATANTTTSPTTNGNSSLSDNSSNSSTNSSSSTSSGSQTSNNDSELDYLTTLSEMISTLLK